MSLDAAAFTALYLAHAGELRGYLAHALPGDADDLTQDVFLKAWANRAQFQAGTNARAWLYRIAHNRLADVYRRRHGVGMTPLTPVLSAYWAMPAHEEPEALVLQAERRRAVRRTLLRLSPKQRLAVWHQYGCGIPSAQGTAVKFAAREGRLRFRRRYLDAF